MSAPYKIVREPLGSCQTLEKVISMAPMVQEPQTRRLSIIYARTKLEVEVPLQWTINKLKCMLTIHFEILNFDQFQLQSNKFLIPGNTQVADLPSNELVVAHTNCQKSFKTYYQEEMGKIAKRYKINTASTYYPILHQSFLSLMKTNIPEEREHSFEEWLPERNEVRNEGDQGRIFMMVLKFIGLAILASILIQYASSQKIAILCAIVCFYFLVDMYVKDNDHKRRTEAIREEINNRRLEKLSKRRKKINENLQTHEMQRQDKQSQTNQLTQNLTAKMMPSITKLEQREKQNSIEPNLTDREQDKKQSKTQQDAFGEAKFESSIQAQSEDVNQISKKSQKKKVVKAKLKLWLAFITEAVYCYFLSIFPNWTVQNHLYANRQRMDRIMDQVKKLDPEASEQIKKWKTTTQ